MGHMVASDVRIVPVTRYPLLTFYTADEGTIIIRNIRDAARRRLGETGGD